MSLYVSIEMETKLTIVSHAHFGFGLLMAVNFERKLRCIQYQPLDLKHKVLSNNCIVAVEIKTHEVYRIQSMCISTDIIGISRHCWLRMEQDFKTLHEKFDSQLSPVSIHTSQQEYDCPPSH